MKISVVNAVPGRFCLVLYLRLDNDCKIAVKSFVNTSPGLFHNRCILQFVAIGMKQIENVKKNINVILSMTRINHFFYSRQILMLLFIRQKLTLDNINRKAIIRLFFVVDD